MKIEKENIYDSIYIKNFKNDFPDTLYHYTNSDSSKAIIESKTFRLSKYDKSNDVFEFSHGLELIVKIINDIKRKGEGHSVNIVCDKFFDWFPREIQNPQMIYFMGSFTSCDNKHLWKKYAANRTGFRLGLRLHPCDLDTIPFAHGPVLYSKNKFEKIINHIFCSYTGRVITLFEKWMAENSYDENMKQMICLMIRDLFVAAAFFKKPKHSIENEYRIIIWSDNAEQKYKALKLDNSKIELVNYKQCSHCK